MSRTKQQDVLRHEAAGTRPLSSSHAVLQVTKRAAWTTGLRGDTIMLLWRSRNSTAFVSCHRSGERKATPPGHQRSCHSAASHFRKAGMVCLRTEARGTPASGGLREKRARAIDTALRNIYHPCWEVRLLLHNEILSSSMPVTLPLCPLLSHLLNSQYSV